MSTFQVANYIECGVWVSIGVVGAVLSIRRKRGAIYTVLLPTTLVAFGISDIVEASTGAWWRPWWLLVWKAVCLAILLVIGVRHLLRARDRQPEKGSS